MGGGGLSLKDLMLLNNLRNLISDPTRITDTSSTLLDPIFISDEIFVLDSGVMQSDRSISDHAMTYLHIVFISNMTLK